METLGQIAVLIFSANSMWSVVARAALWVSVAVVILISSDSPNPEQSLKGLKSNLGFFVLFLALSGGLVYLLFGFTPGA